MQSSCNTGRTSVQDVTCKFAGSSGCSDVTFSCGNRNVGSVNCTMDQSAGAILKAASQSSALATSALLTGSTNSKSSTVSEQSLSQTLTTNCNAQDSNVQNIFSSISCRAARDNFYIWNTYDSNTQCALAQASSALAASSLAAGADAKGDTLNLGGILGIVFGIVGAIILLVVVCWIVQNISIKTKFVNTRNVEGPPVKTNITPQVVQPVAAATTPAVAAATTPAATTPAATTTAAAA